MWHYVNTIDRLVKDRRCLNVLDVGSRAIGENQTYRDLFSTLDPMSVRFKYTGLDVEGGPNVNIVVGDPYDWLGMDNLFDVVISGQAFEHIEYPWETIRQIEKVLKPGGYAVLIGPTTPTIHRFPVDCWRILPDGWNALAKWAKLEVIESTMNQYHGEWHDAYCFLQKGTL